MKGICGNCYIEIKTLPAMATGKKQRGIRILTEQELNSSKQGDRNDSMIIGQMIIVAYRCHEVFNPSDRITTYLYNSVFH